MSAHLLVVDDDARIRNLLSDYLIARGYAVAMAENAQAAFACFENIRFDLIIVDVIMPGDDGFTLTRRIRDRSDVPILILTARSELEHRLEGLGLGADDYMAKPFDPRELVLRIENILRRSDTHEDAPDPITVRFGDDRFDPITRRLTRNGVVIRLTDRETDLLTALAARYDRVATRNYLASLQQSKDPRTVDVLISRLRRKIEKDPRNPEYLLTIWGRGYTLRAAPDPITIRADHDHNAASSIVS